MKKWILLVMVIFLLTGCSGNSQQTDEPTDTPTGADLHNEAELKAYFYETYKVMADSSNILEEDFVADNLSFLYDDFNGDGNEDVICYSDSPSYAFTEIAIITLQDGKYTTIPNQIEPQFVYSQKFYKEGDFLIHLYEGGGTGTSITSQAIYFLDKEKGSIVNTEVALVIAGHINMPSDNGGTSIIYVGEVVERSYKVGTDKDSWLLFEYNYTETDDITQKNIFSKSERYIFDKTTGKYDVELLSETTIDTTQGIPQANEDGVYTFESLKKGQIIDGFNVVEKEKTSEYSTVTLSGEPKTIEGELLYDNEMWDEFRFSSNEKLLSKPIRFTSEGENYDFNSPSYGFLRTPIENFITKEQADYVKQGNTAKIKITATEINFSLVYNAPSGIGMNITNVEWLTDISSNSSNPTDTNSSGKLEGFKNETFYTIKQGEFVVNYPSYRLVVVPLFDSKNKDKLDDLNVEFEGKYINELKFTVFGKFNEAKVINMVDMDDVGEVEYLGDISNRQVYINANLPNDMSLVKVTGKFYDEDDDKYEDIEFVLDNMRDLEEYQIITIE